MGIKRLYMDRKKMCKAKKGTIITILIVIPGILIILPAGFFDEGQSMCLSIMILNIECYGCGMTRAIMHLIHAEFSAAWGYNCLSFLVLPLLIMLYVKLLALYAFNKIIIRWF